MSGLQFDTTTTVVCGWMDSVARHVIRRAARGAPAHLGDRLEEEWLADSAEKPGAAARLSYALGCYWAAAVMSRDLGTGSVPVACSPVWSAHMTAHAHRGPRLLPRKGASSPGPVVCDINITPLIDVLLVLLVTLIVSLPAMTHAVKIDLPQPPPTDRLAPPEVIDLDIEFDGAIAWNGKSVAGLQELEGYFRAAARRDPQPAIHLHPDRHVMYDFVAQVLALAQRNRMQKMAFVNTGEYRD